ELIGQRIDDLLVVIPVAPQMDAEEFEGGSGGRSHRSQQENGARQRRAHCRGQRPGQRSATPPGAVKCPPLAVRTHSHRSSVTMNPKIGIKYSPAWQLAQNL